MNTFLDLPKGRLHFRKIGQGPKLILALHGFAQNAAHFEILEAGLREQVTIFALDLPFHGQTKWKMLTFEPKDVQTWVTTILERENQDKCYLLGHSLGGRIWLSCLDFLWPKILGVFLLAPDGFATKGMFLPDLIPYWGRKGLAKTVQQSGWLLKTALWLHRYHLLSTFAHKYLQHHFRSDDRQQRLLNTWISLSRFSIKLNQIKKILESKKDLKIVIILGKDDPLIAADRLQKITKSLPQIELIILPGGHQIINKHVALELKNQIQPTNQQINE